MRKWLITAALLLPLAAVAQNAPGGQSLASTLDVYVFPSKGQDSSQQSKDESSCYQWAVSNSGVDPFDLQKQEAYDEQLTDAQMQAAQSAGSGDAAQGVIRGAAAGALIGGIGGGHAGRGAAVGATFGLIHGRRKARDEQRQAEASVESAGAARSAATAQELDNFKKAFSVCLESKNYMVKY